MCLTIELELKVKHFLMGNSEKTLFCYLKNNGFIKFQIHFRGENHLVTLPLALRKNRFVKILYNK